MENSEYAEPAFTPGPWRVFRITKGMCSDAQIADAIGNGVAIVEGGNWGREIDDTELEANARLIAAAPEMYAALQEAIEFQNEDTECLIADRPGDGFDEPRDAPCPDGRCRTHGCMVARVNQWRDVLAKAGGQS